MTKGTIALVPLDNRPCTAVFPVRIAEIAGIDVVSPPQEVLGRFLEPGLPDAVLDWLESVAPTVSAMVVSLEMALYGGLVASRLGEISLDVAYRRLDRLARIAVCNPTSKMLVSGAIMRISPTGCGSASAGREEMVRRFSVLLAKSTQGIATAAELRELDDVKRQAPVALIEDYLSARRRDHAINLMSVALASIGVFDFCILGQDDAGEHGPHRAERQVLLDYARRLAGVADGLPEFVRIHPGTDELNMVLLARYISTAQSVGDRCSRSPRISAVFVPDEGRFAFPQLEEQSLGESVRSQIAAAGAIPVDDADSDIILLVHAPDPIGDMRIDHAVKGARAQSSGCGHIDRRVFENLADSARNGKTVAVADVRTLNGADVQFAQALLDEFPLDKLAAYSGWNTAANTIGTALATAIAAWSNPDNWVPRARFLFERLVDDYLYQSCARTAAEPLLESEGMDILNFETAQHNRAELLAVGALRGQAEEVFEKYFTQIGPERCRLAKLSVCLPWDRLFECKVDAVLESDEDQERRCRL